MDLGLIGAVGDAAPPAAGPRRSSRSVRSARVVIAADLGASHASVAVGDLAGEVLAETPPSSSRSPKAPSGAQPWMVDAGLGLLAGLGRSADELIGIGIGVPGPVQHSTGRLDRTRRSCPAGTASTSPDGCNSTCTRPVLVDNDVNIMALGETAVARAEGRPPRLREGGHRHRSRASSRAAGCSAARRASPATSATCRSRAAPDVPCHCGNKRLPRGDGIRTRDRAGAARLGRRRRRRPGRGRPRQARQHRGDPGRAAGGPRHRRGARPPA